MRQFFHGLITLLFSLSGTFICITDVNAQDVKAYQIYTDQGKRTSYRKMLKKIAKSELILFGESHDLSLVHWLELKVLESLAADTDLVLGLEMFEADEQQDLDLFQAGEISQDQLGEKITLWSNYDTDYRPIVDRAIALGLNVVATNAPEEIPREVFRGGFSVLTSLPDDVKGLLPSIPIPYDSRLPGYQKMLDMAHGDMNTENFPKAQAIRDATMAHHIVRYVDDHKVLHLNGSYHSDFYEGICWYIRQYRPATTISTISTVTQEDISSLLPEHEHKADFIICVPEQMPRSYHSQF